MRNNPLASDAAVVARPFLMEKLRDRIEAAGIPSSDAFTRRLDPQTYRPWLLIAKFRMTGMGDEQIATLLKMDLSFVTALISSPVYLHFESVFRSVLASEPAMESIQLRLATGAHKALDTLEHWMDQRHMALAGVSLSAAKTWLSSVGLDTERKRVSKDITITDLTDKQADRLTAGIRDYILRTE